MVLSSSFLDTVDFIQVTLSVYSGTRDPVFNIYSYNPDFASILAATKYRGSTQMNGVMGYHGFQVTLYSSTSHGIYY